MWWRDYLMIIDHTLRPHLGPHTVLYRIPILYTWFGSIGISVSRQSPASGFQDRNEAWRASLSPAPALDHPSLYRIRA